MEITPRAWHVSLLLLGAFALVAGPARAQEEPPRAAGGQATTVRGRITEVSPQSVTIQPRKGAAVKLTVDDRSRLNLREADAKVDQLKEGMRVRATYETKAGMNRLVTLQDPRLTVDRAQGLVNNAVNAAKAYGFRQRDEYRQKLDATLGDLDERLEDLEEQAQEANADARQRYEAEVKELRQKRDELRARYKGLDQATEQSWSDVQGGINQAVDDVQRAIQRARSRFGDATPPERR